MHFIQKPLRYAHSEGHTNVCFSDDGKYIVTCGSEGDVRIWNGFDDEEPVDKCVGDKAYAVVVKGGVMYVGTSNNYVQSFTFPEAELDGVVTRFKAPVTSIDALSNGKTVVSGSQDMEIHVYKDGSLANVLTEHKAPILSVAVDPKGEYFASSSCDGTVKVWKLSDENKEVVSNWDCVPKSNSVETSHTLCKISWTPVTGRVLAVPHKSEIVLYERDSWKKITSLTIPSADEKQLFSVCSISECGKYLAASSTDKKVHVWSINKGKLEFTVETKESVVCSIAWRPASANCEKYELVFCNNDGYLGLVECNPNDKSDNVMNDVEMDGAHNEIELNDDVVNKLVDDDDDGDDEFAISVDKIKADLGFNPDGSMREDRGRSRSRSRSGSRSRSVSRSRSRSPSAVVPRIDMQPPFQPSSTPACLQYRFMAWNDVGIIEQTNTEDDHAISVKFHDSSFHYPLRISNELNYSMGTLSTEAAVFASEKVDGKSSYFGCHPFKKGPEWFTELPEDEEAVGVAAGIGWVAVATSMQTLRLYTVGGNRREVVSLPGPVVCLSGHKNILAASFHTSTGVGGHQWLGFLLMEIHSTDICKYIIPPQSLPVTPHSTLKWMGFSDCGALCTSDSSGFVRLFTSKQGWHPICNTTRHVNGKSDHYFVLGVNEYLQRVKVILCKGSDYPPVIPAPYMTELPWKLPLCGLHEEKGGLEETLWRSKLAAHCLSTCQLTNDEDYGLSDAQKKNTVEINRTTMRLFSMACVENHTVRAFELCQLSNSTLLLQHAMQYAHAQNKTVLAEQIAELLAEKKAQEERSGTADITSLNMYSLSFPDRSIQVLTPWPSSVTDRFTERRLHQSEFHHTIVTGDNEISFENSSQDIFAEPSENRLNSSTSDVTKKVLSPYAGRLSSSKEDASVKRRYFNPFKKVAANTTDLTKSPASALKSALKTKGEKEKLNISDEFSSPKSNLPPFKEWFNTEKENFQKDNPNLSIAQITKIALKKYKELKSSNPLSVATPNSKDTSVNTNNCTNESNSEEVFCEADTPLQDINRKRKLSESNEDNEEKISETKNKKLDESSKKSLKSNKKQTEENQLKKGVVKSASKLTGFFHKK